MFAIIETGGKQYKVLSGQKLKVEKLDAKQSSIIHFDHVLLRADDASVAIGEPYIKGAVVGAKVLREAREKKKIVFRYHSKTRYRKFKTHRQPFTELEITKIY
ncbi:MAG: 50S ribosomal protein L21 [Patescibacteria group bacterium]|nr:50S ribosomal protein L21 [Patescibacteria group bacterium]